MDENNKPTTITVNDENNRDIQLSLIIESITIDKIIKFLKFLIRNYNLKLDITTTITDNLKITILNHGDPNNYPIYIVDYDGDVFELWKQKNSKYKLKNLRHEMISEIVQLLQLKHCPDPGVHMVQEKKNYFIRCGSRVYNLKKIYSDNYNAIRLLFKDPHFIRIFNSKIDTIISRLDVEELCRKLGNISFIKGCFSCSDNNEDVGLKHKILKYGEYKRPKYVKFCFKYNENKSNKEFDLRCIIIKTTGVCDNEDFDTLTTFNMDDNKVYPTIQQAIMRFMNALQLHNIAHNKNSLLFTVNHSTENLGNYCDIIPLDQLKSSIYYCFNISQLEKNIEAVEKVLRNYEKCVLIGTSSSFSSSTSSVVSTGNSPEKKKATANEPSYLLKSPEKNLKDEKPNNIIKNNFIKNFKNLAEDFEFFDEYLNKPRRFTKKTKLLDSTVTIRNTSVQKTNSINNSGSIRKNHKKNIKKLNKSVEY
ncbi:chromatin-associated RNAPIII regulator FPT1 SCDLUD_003591 [Saccharomycodes ludwigii]|uniref:chromatin-associated RNAPIII regulator FPT1 n=1 Tax=Saccharomycodes ludwigii TaxID=36035 RepID=UPI001E88B42A|nr:hypothetical protein SCDLUD_003591 [Saccharomycodes ludwigii]KAH3900599.1 hypothetical protein SCDLUD_003591 [Saccharomycodes ludwigii]